jgi:hypothetical protein
MNRSDFTGLPTSVLAALLWDHVPEIRDALDRADVLVPKIPSAPRFDTVLFRSDGVQYASECDAGQLRYYLMRSQESAAKGGQWAEKDAKRAKALQYFLDWRLVDPHSRWTGERNREKGVVAEPPSSRPKTYPREEQKRDSQRPPAPRRFEDEEPVDDEYGDEGSI